MRKAKPILLRQMSLGLPEPKPKPTHGGARAGAGRPKKAKSERSTLVEHRMRPSHRKGDPVHVTLRLGARVPSLRRELLCRRVKRCLFAQRKKLAAMDVTRFQVVHFSIQDNHLHLIVEAKDKSALARGVAGLEIRVARAVNKALGRKGSLWAGRYHRHDLRSPTETRNALRYVLLNSQKHHRVIGDRNFADPHSSAPSFDGFMRSAAVLDDPHRSPRWPPVTPRTWLLGVGWRRRGLIDPTEIPPSSPHA